VRLDRAAKLTPSNSSVSIAIRWSRRPAPRWAIARSTTLDVETFRGNGRTCRTCHSKKNGTFSPEDARERLAEDPTDSLFVHDGLDGGLEGTFPSPHASASFFGCPAGELTTLKSDVAVVGIPYDLGHGTNPGTRFGPQAMRRCRPTRSDRADAGSDHGRG